MHGSAVLQVSEPRTPCWKLGMRLGDPALPRAFAAPDVPASCCVSCARGHCKPATPSRCRRSLHRVTAADVTAMYYGDHLDTARIAAPELAAHWREWVAHRTIWHLDEEHKRAEQGGDSA